MDFDKVYSILVIEFKKMPIEILIDLITASILLLTYSKLKGFDIVDVFIFMYISRIISNLFWILIKIIKKYNNE